MVKNVEVLTDRRLKIYEILTREGKKSTSDLIREFGVSGSTMVYHLRQLTKAGYIRRWGNPGKDGYSYTAYPNMDE